MWFRYCLYRKAISILFGLKMAARVEGMFAKENKDLILNSRLLVVGAGGIGCEVLKTLVLTGFEDIVIIDLDTIELSNLNRQFLFHKQHIGKPKAVVARENVLKFNPKAKIIAHHDSITNVQYSVEFYRQFTAVANALDNVAARSHVNRMCMAADVPLVESGSAGYLGQTTVYKRKVTECFECLPRKPQRTYPGCTIRNTPSEPVHCIVWSKALFNQLFGETDADDEVSPDVSDPSLGEEEKRKLEEEGSFEQRVSTREWAKSVNYDPFKLFNKLFCEDIQYLKKMTDLWKRRPSPVPLDWNSLPDAVPGCSQHSEIELEAFRPWNIKECVEVFKNSILALRKRIEDGGSDTILTWDKDDDDGLDFVASCSNLRSYCFHIQQKSRFDIKAIAGNIIPAIATTNAVVAGLVVLQILKVLKGDLNKCKTSWLNENYLSTNKLISCGQLEKPNPMCMVCSTSSPEITIKLNIKSLTLRTLDEKILKEKLHMVQPDAVINDGTGTILLSSDPEDMSEETFEKPLSSFNLCSDSRLLCEDFFQNFKIHLVIIDCNELNGQDFEIVTDVTDLKPEQDEKDGKENKHDEDQDKDEIMDVEAEIDILPGYYAPKPKSAIEEEENGMEPPKKKIKTGPQ